MTSKTELRGIFEGWLADMEHAVSQFKDSLPPELRSRLNYSPESLDALEAWLLEHYASVEALLAEPEVLDGAARYVGQTFRERLGGTWDVELDDPSDVNYKLPLLTGFQGQYSPLSPITLVTAAADRRTGSYIRGVFDNVLHRSRTASQP